MRGRFALLGVALVAMGGGGPAGHTGVVSRPQSSILFAALGRGEKDRELFRVLPNGRQLNVITRNVFEDDAPAWSPNRLHIAFSRYAPRAELCRDTCKASIWTMYVDGSQARRITRPPSADNWVDVGASWSPNGRSLVFERYDPSRGSIMTVARNGSHLRRLVGPSDDFPSYPAWGPTGLIAFASSADGGGIFVMKPDGSSRRKLVGNPRDTVLASPIWSPSGSRIAYLEPELRHIYVASAATGAILKAIPVPAPSSEMRIAASPDFRTLAFNGRNGIYLIGIDGRNLRRLGAGNAAIGGLRNLQSPAWR